MSTTRFTIDLDKTSDKALSAIAEAKGTTKAEIIKRALATYSFLSEQAPAASGQKISVTNQNDEVLKDIIIP